MRALPFTLDTSGAVFVPGFHVGHMWSDLDPFAQGYVEALFRTAHNVHNFQLRVQPHGWRWLRFSDLAPETLSTILEDCAEVRAVGHTYVNTALSGGHFYADRQAGHLRAFPPLDVTLGDDGKVRFA